VVRDTKREWLLDDSLYAINPAEETVKYLCNAGSSQTRLQPCRRMQRHGSQKERNLAVRCACAHPRVRSHSVVNALEAHVLSYSNPLLVFTPLVLVEVDLSDCVCLDISPRAIFRSLSSISGSLRGSSVFNMPLPYVNIGVGVAFTSGAIAALVAFLKFSEALVCFHGMPFPWRFHPDAVPFLQYAQYETPNLLLLQREARADTSVKPTVDRAEVAAILREIESSIRATNKLYDAAAKLPATKEEKAGMKEAASAMLRRDVAEIQRNVLTKHNITEEAIQTAQQYYLNASPPDREISTLTQSIKKAIGRHVMTKKRILQALIAFHEYQITIMPECVEAAMDAGPPQSPMFMQIIQGKPRAMGDEWIAAEYGLASAQDLINMAISEGSSDKLFGDAVNEILQEQGAKLQQTAQQVMQATVMERMGGMGGMGGFGGDM
jgi:hypothetical protein